LVSTTLALNREDNGKTVRLAVGDTIQVSLPEMDTLAAWKVEVDTSVLAYAEQTEQDSYWLLGGDLQTFVRIFQARSEGVTDLVMTCQKIGENRVDILDVFRVQVIVGHPERRKAARPAEEQVAVQAAASSPADTIFLLFEILLLAMGAFMLSYRLATLAMNISISDVLFGLLGAIGSGVVTIYVALKIVSILNSKVK